MIEAGIELNARIAVEAMGAYWTERENVCRILWNAEGEEMVLEEWYEKGWVPSKAPLPYYSTRIQDAMPVFDKMIEKVGVASIIRYAPKGREPHWVIEWRYRGAQVREQTLELAICAFALAVGGSDGL